MPTDGEDRVLNPGWVILCDEGLRRLHYGMCSERSTYSIRHSFPASGFWLLAIGYRLSAIGYRLSAIGYRLSASAAWCVFLFVCVPRSQEVGVVLLSQSRSERDNGELATEVREPVDSYGTTMSGSSSGKMNAAQDIREEG